MSVFHVPAQALPKALGLGASLGIEKVIEATDEETVDEVQRHLEGGSKQFWTATRGGEFIGCLITENVSRETNNALVIRYMTGKEPEKWLPMAADIMRPLAIAAGCGAVYADTREGLRKMLVGYGWKKVSVRMRLDLSDGR